jgi:hypothetical protein
MSHTWVSLLGHLVAPALVVAWSPVKIIPALALVLHAGTPKASRWAFLLGSLAGLAAVTALFVEIHRVLDGLENTPHEWTAWARVALGAALVLLAGYRWVRRDRAVRLPRWIFRFPRISPITAATIGVVLAVANPKVLVMNAAAGLAISTAAVGIAGRGVAVAYYTVIAGSTIIVPIVGYTLAADPIDRWLVSARHRMTCHQPVLTTVILAVIGAVLVCTSVRAV